MWCTSWSGSANRCLAEGQGNKDRCHSMGLWLWKNYRYFTRKWRCLLHLSAQCAFVRALGPPPQHSAAVQPSLHLAQSWTTTQTHTTYTQWRRHTRWVGCVHTPCGGKIQNFFAPSNCLPTNTQQHNTQEQLEKMASIHSNQFDSQEN